MLKCIEVMIPNRKHLIEAIKEEKKGCLRFYSKADSGVTDLVRAPMDYSSRGGMQEGVNDAENCQPVTEGETMAFYLSQERWGRVCLHFVAALRAGHWGWHLAGIVREIECVWPQSRRASAPANGWPEPGNNPSAKPA